MRGDSADLIDVYRTKWQAGSEVLSNVGDLMWDCGKAAAADHFNCMDRSRGFGGHQFEGQPQIFPRADWVRNCFNCGQPGHLARECPQNLVRRGVGVQFGFLQRGGIPPQRWPFPGIRPLALNPREAAFLLNGRDDGQQLWQQQVANDFQDSRVPGIVGRDSGNRNNAFIHSRVGDRARDRHSGWADFDAHSNLSLPSRVSDESHRKTIPPRRPVVKRNGALRGSPLRKEAEDNDGSFRAPANASSSVVEEGGKSSFTEEKPPSSRAEKDGLFETKPPTDREIGPESASDCSHSQARVLADSDDPRRALQGNKAESRSQEKDSSTSGLNARPPQALKDERVDLDLENGEFVSEGNSEWPASSNHPVGKDPVISKSNYDGKELVLQQTPTEPAILNGRAIKERKPSSKTGPSPDAGDVRVKTATDDGGDLRSRSDNSCSLKPDCTAKETGINIRLERKGDGKGGEGAELLSASNEARNGGTCQGTSQDNRSPAGPVYGNEVRDVDSEANVGGDLSGDSLGSGIIVKRHTDPISLEGDLISCDKNSNMQCRPLSSTPPVFKVSESQRSLHPAFISPVPVREHNFSGGWKGRYANEWKNSHKANERGETVRFDSGEFSQSQCNGKTNILPRRSGSSELTGQDFQSEHVTRNNECKDWSSVEHKVCEHVSLVAGARLQQNCAACQAEGSVKLVNGIEMINSDNVEKGAVPIVGSGIPNEVEGSHKGFEEKNTDSVVSEEGYNIDARVEKLMLNFPLVQGREQESVADALMAASQRITEDDYEGGSEEIPSVARVLLESQDMAVRTDAPAGCEGAETPAQFVVKSPGRAKLPIQVSNTNCWKYPTAGGDWRLTQTEKAEPTGVSGGKVISWKKEVMNMGVSLCEVDNGGVSDPRRLIQGVAVSQHRKLEVPGWACAAIHKMENSLDVQPHPTELVAGKVGSLSHLGGHSEVLSTKASASTPKPLKAPSVGVIVQNEISGIRGKDPLKKSGQTRIIRKKPETTNILHRTASTANQTTASVTVQVVTGVPLDSDSRVGALTDLNSRHNSRNSVELANSFPQPDQQSAGDVHDLSLFYGKVPAVTSKRSKDLAPAVLRRHELQLESGVWHFLDAAGHERGPFFVSALLRFVTEGLLPPAASVFRKSDNIWIPVSHLLQYFNAHAPAPASTPLAHRFEDSCYPVKSAISTEVFTRGGPANLQLDFPVQSVSSSTFHCDHPQFLGYTNGKLHELVMKSFRGSFAGFFNDALDIWSNSKRSTVLPEVVALDIALGEETALSTSLQANVGADVPVKRSFGLKKIGGKTRNENRRDVESLRSQMESFADKEIQDVPSPASQSPNETTSSNVDGSLLMAEQNFWSEGGRSADDMQLCRGGLPHISVVEVDGSNSSTASQVAVHATMATSTGTMAKEVPSDQEISETGAVHEQHSSLDAGGSSSQSGWASLTSRLLSKVLRLLRGDPKSLAAAMATCQSWKDCAQHIKLSTKHIDLSGLGSHCDDTILGGLLGYGGGKLRRITLDHCMNVSSKGLGRLLKSYPAIREVAISGCVQLRELVELYPQVKWVGNPWAVPQGLDLLRYSVTNNKFNQRDVGGKREHGDDGHSGCSLDEIGYRDKSTEESESPGTNHRIDPLVKDADAFQVGYPSRDSKRLKANAGNGVRNGFGINVGKTDDQQSVGTVDEKELQLKKRRNAYSSKRKLNNKLIIKTQNSALGSSKKVAVSSQKADNVAKEVLWSSKNTEKDIDKILARALRVVMDADSDQLFYRLANEQVPEGRGAFAKPVQTDFCTVQKKLKMGHYRGKDGVKSFKEDLLQPLRSAFRLEHDSLMYKTAGRLFKVVHQVGQQLDNQLSKPQNREPADGQSKALGSCVTSTRTLLKSKGSKDLTVEKHRSSKRSWDSGTGGGRFVKRTKVLSIMNSRSDGDMVSRESDLQGSFDRDKEIDRDSRRARMRRNQWTESEAESSDEEDIDEALYDEPEDEDTETSGSDIASKSELADETMEDYNEGTESDDAYSGFGGEGSSRDWWGARMTKAAMVPPLTRKYEVIEEYRIVDDFERVAAKMKVSLPDDYQEKLKAANEKGGDRYAHLDVPELKDFKPRKRLGEEVLEQEVYGIDPFTYNLLLNTMPADSELFTDKQKQLFIEEKLLRTLNREVSSFTGSGKAPMEYSLEKVITHICNDMHSDQPLQIFCRILLKNMKNHLNDKYVAYRKGLGVVCNKREGFDDGDFVVEFFGEVYPPWRWYEKQDGIRSLQKKDKDPAPEFYNIVFERPKGDSLGYDVLVVDAMHKANFASRLCHSCRPNCEAKVTAVEGKYMIGVYTLRKIEFGEELTFDYCCVTESKEEHDSSVCLCGSQGCKGSYLCYTGPGAYDEVLKEYHGILDRHNLLLQACTSGAVTFREQDELKQAGLGPSLLDGLPQWVIKYAAGIVSYLNFERLRLPDELMKADMQRHTGLEIDRQDIEVQTEGVYNQRLQNLAITLDKVRHILAKLYGEDASMAPPPLRMLEPHELVDFIWKGKDSVVGELLQCMAVHAPEGLADLTRQIQEHNPPPGGDIEENLRKSLLWLRDTLRKVPATCVGRHDAAADLIHLYAYTKYFFTNYDYGLVDSQPILIYACDLGPKHSGSGPYMWRKSYSKNYIWGQLISWFRQTSADPGASLVQDRRGCLMLPDISSCYARTIQHDFRCGYSDKDRKRMVMHMETHPQKKWTRKFTPELWNFKSDRGLFGSPMLDAAVSKTKLNKECIQWLKTRETVFHGPWDEE
ncbi:hypothetical protein M758_3G245200 [Ceratodon purpureus]|nr:hypothetical protein M758_3G245200 [Ceratodon purpureus]